VCEILGKCYKCGGTGYIEEYSHIRNGICFACNGQGWDNDDTEELNRQQNESIAEDYGYNSYEDYACAMKEEAEEENEINYGFR